MIIDIISFPFGRRGMRGFNNKFINPPQPSFSEGGRISLMKKLVIIDGNALLHRAYHAIQP